MKIMTRKSFILQLESLCQKTKTLEAPFWGTPSFSSTLMRNPLTFKAVAGSALPMFSYAKIYLLPNPKMLVFEVPQAITCLTFLIPMSRVMLGLRVLGVKGLVWLWQMRNPINEVLNSIQDIISTELKRTNTPTRCTTEFKLWEEPPLNNSLLQTDGFARWVYPPSHD